MPTHEVTPDGYLNVGAETVQAPAPEREVASTENPTYQVNHEQFGQPGAPTPQAPTATVATSPPPEDPELAAENSRLRRENEEMKQNFGAMNRKIEEMRLVQEMNVATGRAQTPMNFQVPAGVDPSAPMTVQDAVNFQSGMIPALTDVAKTQALRASWDVTSEEEASVLQDYPQAAQTPDPARSEFVLKAVRARRAEQKAQQAALEATPTSDQTVAPSRTVRPAAPVVPHVEATVAPHVPEPSPAQDPMQQAQVAYNNAYNMPQGNKGERQARLGAMRQARDHIAQMEGGDERYKGFVQKS